ncbi:MAG: hypothetical protein GY859_43950, partial [Desulfobacterales bacterium]|nr:hypothetical protein [Desulfobacterales bacterium]
MKTIHAGAARKDGVAEGWTLSAHHHVNVWDASTLYKGDGSVLGNNAMIIDTFAGGGSFQGSGMGGPAVGAGLGAPFGVAVDAEGCVYIADYTSHCVFKVDADGVINRAAGTGAIGYSGDGGPAVDATLRYPYAVAVDAGGAIYIVDYYSHCVRKVDAEGIITTVAGNGTKGYGGDGGPAIEAMLNMPTGVAVDAWGAIYIADRYNNRIRKVDAGGVITTVAGNGTAGFRGDGGPAIEARLYIPRDLAVDAAGNIYIADTGNRRVRKVDATGVITTVAGDGTEEYGTNQGDGGLAVDAPIDSPMGVDVDAMGAIYIADIDDNRIRRVDPAGFITTVAGIAVYVFPGSDGGPATRRYLKSPFDAAVDASGNIYIAGGYSKRVRKVGFPSAFEPYKTVGDIPFAEPGGRGHIMSGAGRHLRTMDPEAGVVLREFGYDEHNKLVSVTDRFGNQTIIARDGNGAPAAIVSPDGLTTTLTVDESNHLTRITYPDGAHYDFEYTPDGLMTAEIEPEGNRFEHDFDGAGNVTNVRDEEGGAWVYSRTAFENGETLTEILSAEGNLTSI